MQEWEKTITYQFLTDYNIDKSVHILLFIMAKNGMLSDYLINLVKKDIEENYKNSINETFCEKIILKEMGYSTKELKESLQIVDKIIEGLQENKQNRDVLIEMEQKNSLAKKYSKNNNKEIKEEKIEAQIILKEELEEKRPKEKESGENQSIDYSSTIQEIKSDPLKSKALDGIAGL